MVTTPRPSVVEARVRFSTRLNYVILPIDWAKFPESLQERGFTFSQRIPAVPVGTGISLEPPVFVARKGNNRLDMNTEKEVFGVEGNNSDEVFSDYVLFEHALRTALSADYEDHVSFFETIGEIKVRGSTNALQASRALYKEKASMFEKLSTIIGESVSPLGLRLASTNSVPISEEWTDLRIEPVVISPGLYFVSLVYRNRKREKCSAFLKNLEDKALKLVLSVEQEIGDALQTRSTLKTVAG